MRWVGVAFLIIFFAVVLFLSLQKDEYKIHSIAKARAAKMKKYKERLKAAANENLN